MLAKEKKTICWSTPCLESALECIIFWLIHGYTLSPSYMKISWLGFVQCCLQADKQHLKHNCSDSDSNKARNYFHLLKKGIQKQNISGALNKHELNLCSIRYQLDWPCLIYNRPGYGTSLPANFAQLPCAWCTHVHLLHIYMLLIGETSQPSLLHISLSLSMETNTQDQGHVHVLQRHTEIKSRNVQSQLWPPHHCSPRL